MLSRWNPAYDLLLRDMHARGMTDYGICGHLLDQGIPIAVIDVAAARRRMGLPANRLASWEQPMKPARERPSPLGVAHMTLGRSLVEKPSGYWLDNLSANLETIMQACNRVRKNMGLNQVDANPRWRVA